MSTTLWQKFQAALSWLHATSTAGVRAIKASPYVATPFDLLDTEVATIAPPDQATDGANIIGLTTVNLTFVHDTANPDNTTTVSLWLYNGREWCFFREVECAGHTGVLDPVDAEGLHRIAASVLDADIGGNGDATAITLSVTPYNPEN